MQKENASQGKEELSARRMTIPSEEVGLFCVEAALQIYCVSTDEQGDVCPSFPWGSTTRSSSLL